MLFRYTNLLLMYLLCSLKYYDLFTLTQPAARCSTSTISRDDTDLYIELAITPVIMEKHFYEEGFCKQILYQAQIEEDRI